MSRFVLAFSETGNYMIRFPRLHDPYPHWQRAGSVRCTGKGDCDGNSTDKFINPTNLVALLGPEPVLESECLTTKRPDIVNAITLYLYICVCIYVYIFIRNCMVCVFPSWVLTHYSVEYTCLSMRIFEDSETKMPKYRTRWNSDPSAWYTMT